MMSSKLRFLLLALMVRRADGATCPKFGVEIIQGGVDEVHLPVLSADSVTDFYSYNNPEVGSYNGEVPVPETISIIFMHQDSVTCLKSLVVVHDGDFSGGEATFTFTPGDLRFAAVQDGGSYAYDTGTLSTRVTWNWITGKTDGVAYTLPPLFSCITVTPDFDNLYGWWEWAEPKSANTVGQYKYRNMVKDKPMKICLAPYPTPEPDDPAPKMCDENTCGTFNIFCRLWWFIRCGIFN